MLEGFRVPVSQHLGGLGYPNVGVSSVRRQRWRRAAGTDQHLDSKGGGARIPLEPWLV